MPPRPDAVTALADAARARGAALADRAAQARDPEYWRQLVPQCHVGGAQTPDLPFDAGDITARAAAWRRDGYFRLPALLPPALIDTLTTALTRVVDAGWPAPFLFMYDEAWWPPRLPATRRFVAETIGDARQIRHVWVHRVSGTAESHGWGPHVDGDEGGLTLWAALTAATPDSGCMYVVPHDASRTGLIDRLTETTGQFAWAEVVALLHHARALPVSAGDALGWHQRLLHWGGRSTPGAPDRISLSYEFVEAGRPEAATEFGRDALDTLPSFEARLDGVTRGLAHYQRFEPMVARFAPLLDALRTP